MNNGKRKKWFFPALLIICGIAFLIRLQVCRELKNADSQVVNPSVYTDMYTYKDYSEKIVKGQYDKTFYYQPFYYAVFLPVIKKVFGFNVWPVMLCQILISIATIWLSGMMSARLWGRASGIITALLLTFSSIMILYVPYYLIATLQAFWVTLIAFLSLTYLDYELTENKTFSKSIFNWGVLGFFIGIGILTRGNIWFFLPGIIFSVLFFRIKYTQKGQSWFKKLFPVFFLLVMMILPQIPFALENTIITGKLCGPSTAAGAVLSLGNTPESPPGGREAGMGPGPMEYPKTFTYWNAEAENIPVYKQMWSWFCREPLAFCELQLRKMLLFWDRREIPNNIAVEYQGIISPTWRITGLVPVWEMKIERGPSKRYIVMNLIPFSLTLLVLGLAGTLYLFFKIFRKTALEKKTELLKVYFNRIAAHLKIYLLLYFIIAYWLGTAAFYILARFRLPVLPLLAVFAGGFLHSIIWSFKNDRPSMRKLIALVLAVIIVGFGYDYYRNVMEAQILKKVRPDGVVSPMGKDLLLMDNGPFSFGAWRFFELKQNMSIEKAFSLPDLQHGDKVRFMVNIFWDVPGRMILEVNGEKVELKEEKQVKKLYEFSIPKEDAGNISLKATDMDCRAFMMLDYQRNYGRTSIDGINPEAELVSQLLFSESKKD